MATALAEAALVELTKARAKAANFSAVRCFDLYS